MPRGAGAIAESWAALGTDVRVVVSAEGDATAARRAVVSLLDAVDRACSRFRDDSELSALNRASGRWTAAGPLLLDALLAARWAAVATDGAVDPTIGRALRAAGYDRDFAAVSRPTPCPPGRPAPAPGWRTIEIDERLRRVRLAPGVELDLGSTGKALAADRAAAAALAASGAAGVLVSLGGDIAVAGRPPHGGWPVLVAEESTASGADAGPVVLIAAGGIATSSARARRWTRGGVELHHIIDPATGAPAAGPWRTATVAAASCLHANAAATAAIVLGPAAPAWLASRGLPARLVDADGGVEAVGPWPAAARVRVPA